MQAALAHNFPNYCDSIGFSDKKALTMPRSWFDQIDKLFRKARCSGPEPHLMKASVTAANACAECALLISSVAIRARLEAVSWMLRGDLRHVNFIRCQKPSTMQHMQRSDSDSVCCCFRSVDRLLLRKVSKSSLDCCTAGRDSGRLSRCLKNSKVLASAMMIVG